MTPMRLNPASAVGPQAPAVPQSTAPGGADLKTDPSNRDSNKGIVTVAYEPYTPLLDAMRALNAEAYRLTAYFDRPR